MSLSFQFDPVSIRFRRGTAAQWTAANPVLASGEPGYETDTGKFKVGDGTTAWNSLTYSSGIQGDTGPAGSAGPAGPAGAAGADGADGHSPVLTWSGDQILIDGVASGPHLTGPAGSAGATGATGPAGPAGPAGADGPNTVTLSTTTDLIGFLAGNGSHVRSAGIADVPSNLRAYDIHIPFVGSGTNGKPAANQPFTMVDFARPVRFYAGIPGSRGRILTANPAATYTATITIYNSSGVSQASGSVSISTGGVFTFTWSTTYTAIAGDYMLVKGQASADTTLQDLTMTICGELVDMPRFSGSGLTWNGAGYTSSGSSGNLDLVVTSAWAAGLRPDRVRVIIRRATSNTFTNIGFYWTDGSYQYQWDPGSTYGYLSGDAPGVYVHEAIIYEGGIDTYLGDLAKISLYSNGGTDVAFSGDVIEDIQFKIGGAWVSYR